MTLESTPDKTQAARSGPTRLGGDRNPPRNGDTHDLAAALETPLRAMCLDRLGPVEWFRCSWQRGAAATGKASWAFPDGSATDVIVKLPVGPKEYAWTVGLGNIDHDRWSPDLARSLPVPRVLASGDVLNGYDLAWFVIERLAGPALHQEIGEPAVQELLRTAAEFHAGAQALRPVEGPGEQRDWGELVERSREQVGFTTMPEPARWKVALQKLAKALPRVLAVWNTRPRDTWCHGDLHFGNAMRRDLGDGGPGRCVLLDMAFVHPGHWVEDAVYVERQFWAHPEMLGKTKPVQELRRHRKALGLDCDGGHAELAAARRVLMAGCAPAWWETEGSAAYARGALEILERYLPKFAS